MGMREEYIAYVRENEAKGFSEEQIVGKSNSELFGEAVVVDPGASAPRPPRRSAWTIR